MRILLTNNTLGIRAGTELYVRDVAVALLARGHQPIAYSGELGEVADLMRAATVAVVDDLHKIAEAPDVIHGHHHLETMTALNHFPGVPAIFLCHGWMPWQEAPPIHPRIVRYVAVDELCRQRLVHEGGIPPEITEILLNFVDLERFQKRLALPNTARKALLYSNYPGTEGELDEIRRACSDAEIELDVVGLSSENPSDSPESLLPSYDVVFSKGRSALEAMAVGCAVVLVDSSRTGPMVNTSNFEKLRSLNFGLRSLSSPLDVEGIRSQLSLFDRKDAAAVRDLVRNEAGLDRATDRLVDLYRQCAGFDAAPSGAEARATADYLRGLAERVKENEQLQRRLIAAVEETGQWRRGAERLGEANEWLGGQKQELEQAVAALSEENSRLRRTIDEADE